MYQNCYEHKKRDLGRKQIKRISVERMVNVGECQQVKHFFFFNLSLNVVEMSISHSIERIYHKTRDNIKKKE